MKHITLSKNKMTVVDDEDYEFLTSLGKWYASEMAGGIWYAEKRLTPLQLEKLNTLLKEQGKQELTKRTLLMHRLITDCPAGLDVDHIDRDGLNNQKNNLRRCTRSENSQNKKVRKDSNSGYKGVWERTTPVRKQYQKKDGTISIYESIPKKRFQASILEPETKKRIKLGSFETAEEAALAYNKAALEYFGEYAILNEIEK